MKYVSLWTEYWKLLVYSCSETYCRPVFDTLTDPMKRLSIIRLETLKISFLTNITTIMT